MTTWNFEWWKWNGLTPSWRQRLPIQLESRKWLWPNTSKVCPRQGKVRISSRTHKTSHLTSSISLCQESSIWRPCSSQTQQCRRCVTRNWKLERCPGKPSRRRRIDELFHYLQPQWSCSTPKRTCSKSFATTAKRCFHLNCFQFNHRFLFSLEQQIKWRIQRSRCSNL